MASLDTRHNHDLWAPRAEGPSANALRQRRWRQRPNAALNADILPHRVEIRSASDINGDSTVYQPLFESRVTVSTIQMCELAGRLESGRVTLDDLALASRLIIALVKHLPADGS